MGKKYRDIARPQHLNRTVIMLLTNPHVQHLTMKQTVEAKRVATVDGKSGYTVNKENTSISRIRIDGININATGSWNGSMTMMVSSSTFMKTELFWSDP